MEKEIKNLDKAATRILKAIKDKERIILYGDADLDGVASIIILEETIKNLGGKISSFYFPDRETEGYGISESGLNYLKEFSPALLIALDCGIGNFAAVKSANKMGFKVIIIDHHEILDGVPEAEIVVDPKQKGDSYPFKGLANAGIIFKISQLILKDRMNDSLRKNFLELVALATIADMMPREEENIIFIGEGIESLKNSWRPGIRAFFEGRYFEEYSMFDQKVSKIISTLNVRDVEDHLPACFRLLTFSSIEESMKLIEGLLGKRELSRKKTEEIIQEVEKKIAEKPESEIIFEGESDWEVSLISHVASTICQKYQKPTFIFKKIKEESQGAVRVPSGVDSVALMKKCKSLLLTFGGHAAASGFRIKSKKLEEFRQCLIKNFKEEQ